MIDKAGGLHADRNGSACAPAARCSLCLRSCPSASRGTPPIGSSAGVPSVRRDLYKRWRRSRRACARILSFSLLMSASLANVRAFPVPPRAGLPAVAAPQRLRISSTPPSASRLRGGGPSCGALRVGASTSDPLCPPCALASSSGLCSRRAGLICAPKLTCSVRTGRRGRVRARLRAADCLRGLPPRPPTTLHTRTVLGGRV
jgi:hypothetical protein